MESFFSPLAERVQAQLAASRALLAQAPSLAELEKAVSEHETQRPSDVAEWRQRVDALESERRAQGWTRDQFGRWTPPAQRGNGSAPLLLVLFLACALGTGIGYGVMHIGGQLVDAIAQAHARR